MKTMLTKRIPELERFLLVLHHPLRAPSDEDWDDNLRELLDLATSASTPYYELVLTDGPGPNARQRDRAAKQFGAAANKQCVIAIISPSALTRGVITAMNWMGITGMRPYAPEAINGALDFLRVDRSKRPALIEHARAALPDLGGGPARALRGLLSEKMAS